MDDIKLYAATNNQLQELLQLTQIFSRHIRITFGIQKCKTLSIVKKETRTEKFHSRGRGHYDSHERGRHIQIPGPHAN
jgi:hypothetical protein